MNPLYSKAQKQIGESSSKAGSKSSSRKAARKKKRAPKEKEQNAGQPSGPGGSVSAASQRSSRSRSAVDRDRGEDRSGGSTGESSSALGSKFASYTVGALHVIDMGLGTALLVYGGMVHVASVTAAAVCYGLVLALGAVAGAVGYFSGACNRRGLWVSAFAGGLACLLDIGAFIAVIAGWDAFIKFLTDNHEALILSTDGVKTIQGLKILFAVIFIVLAGLEVHRGLHMWGMKDTMSDARVSPTSRGSSDSKCNWFLSLFGLSKRKKTDDFVVFDDNASLESSLLWSKDAAQPTSDDYLEFVPEHERALANYMAHSVIMEPPQADAMDY